MGAGSIFSLVLCAAIVGWIAAAAAGRHEAFAQGYRSHAIGAGAFSVVLVVGLSGVWTYLTGLKFDASIIPLDVWVDEAVDWLLLKVGDPLDQLNRWVVHKIGFFERFLHQSVAWPLLTLLFTGIAWHASRNLVVTVGVALAFLLIWSMALWKPTMQTLSLMSVSILVTVVVGLPLGILMSQSDRARSIMLPILDMMQTMPSFVYLIPVVMLLGLGNFAGVIATMIYAAPPLIRLTDLGIRLVDKEVMEAATSFGASRRQKLFNVQIPLALPNIMAGLNQSIMMALAMVVIASMIGVRGLGQEVLFGLQRQEPGTGFIAGLSIVLIAIVLDRITQSYGRRMETHRTVGH